jgi:hypothetical protein
MARDVVLLLVVRLQLTEEPYGSLEIAGRKMLAAHDQHMMIGEGLVQHDAGLAVDRPSEIEAGDLSASVICQRRDGERCHERSLHANILFAERYRRTGVRVKKPKDPA